MKNIDKPIIKTAIATPKKKRLRKTLFIFIISLVALSLIVLVGIPFVAMRMFGLNKPVTFAQTLTPAGYGIDAVSIELITDDNLGLEAWEVTAEQPRAEIIFLSGIQNPSVTFYFPHAKWLQSEGYSSILLEMRAHGGSEGDEIALGMKEYLDVKAAVDYIKKKDKNLPVIVFGVSMGGATAINSFGEIPELDGLISLSAYANWPDAFCYNMELMGIPEPIPTIEKHFVWLYMGVTYGFDCLRVNPLNEIEKHKGRPALLMHSTQDREVPFTSFEKLSAKIPQAETFVREGDFHMITSNYLIESGDDPEYTNAILEFLNKHF